MLEAVQQLSCILYIYSLPIIYCSIANPITVANLALITDLDTDLFFQ